MRILLLALTVPVFLQVSLACQFVFSYEAIRAPLGTWGEVGIRVYKTHARCTLPSPEEYRISAVGAQILSQTPWREIQPNVLEKWVILSLAQVGEGYLKISKTCTKEGYAEALLPLSVDPPADSGVWALAMSGTYPFDLPGEAPVYRVSGEPEAISEHLVLEGLVFRLPEALPFALPREVALFYTVLPHGELFPLLLVGEGIFLRFDHRLPQV